MPADQRPRPDWVEIHREYKRKGVTLSLLWQEYKAQSPAGYQYGQFCDRYRAWISRLDPCMRQEYKAGEKLFVDSAGQTAPVVGPATGEVRPAQIFLALWGASNYTYAEATWSQTLPDWIGSHVRALTFFGSVTAVIVPDNLRSGVTKPCRYVIGDCENCGAHSHNRHHELSLGFGEISANLGYGDSINGLWVCGGDLGELGPGGGGARGPL
jgi:transposase